MTGPAGGTADGTATRDLRPVTRLTAYAVLPHTGPAGRGHVLVRSSERSDHAGCWSLPGGGVDHGELPVEAVVREVREETGLQVRVSGLRDVLTDVVDLAHRGVRVHTVRVLYDAEVTGGSLRPEVGNSTDAVRVLPAAQAADLPLLPWVATTLGLPEPAPAPVNVPVDPRPLSGVGGDPAGALARPDGPVVRQRIGVYGIAVRPAPGVPGGEEVLLTSIAPHAPGAGLWTLPGGGIDHGESVREALGREVHEETGLHVETSRLLGVDAERFTGRSPSGVLEDFQAVRVVFAVTVGSDEPRVVEVDGSTDAVGWVPRAEVAALPCVGFVADALALLSGSAAPTVGT